MLIVLFDSGRGLRPPDLVKNQHHSGTLADLEGVLTYMSVHGSNAEKTVVAKSSARNPIKAGDSAGQSVPGDGNSRGAAAKRRRELGGPDGPDPTRYGDWERKGRCIDF
jgi:hypothetical protein